MDQVMIQVWSIHDILCVCFFFDKDIVCFISYFTLLNYVIEFFMFLKLLFLMYVEIKFLVF